MLPGTREQNLEHEIVCLPYSLYTTTDSLFVARPLYLYLPSPKRIHKQVNLYVVCVNFSFWMSVAQPRIMVVHTYIVLL